MNKSQSNTFELLIILGVILVLVSPIGQWLAEVVQQITTHHNVTLNFNPFAQGPSTVMGANQPAGGGSNALVGHYTIDLAGGGQMTVNANSQAAAIENVKAEGGTPANA